MQAWVCGCMCRRTGWKAGCVHEPMDRWRMDQWVDHLSNSLSSPEYRISVLHFILIIYIKIIFLSNFSAFYFFKISLQHMGYFIKALIVVFGNFSVLDVDLCSWICPRGL